MNNSKVHMVFYLWKRQFIESLLKKQTICGYLLGGVLMMVFSVQYLNYAGNRSIQCLEPMIVTMINPIASLLLFIGLILILPDPPFVNNRSAMMFYRSTRKTWMCGMLCYMASHIILYHIILCLFTDCKYGFHNEPQLYREYLEQGADTHGKRGKNGSDI